MPVHFNSTHVTWEVVVGFLVQDVENLFFVSPVLFQWKHAVEMKLTSCKIVISLMRWVFEICQRKHPSFGDHNLLLEYQKHPIEQNTYTPED